MKKLYLLALVLLVSVTSLSAQNHTVSGYVKDASNGETLIGASVLIKGTSQGVVTNVYGFYSITLPAGSYELEYRYIGYLSSLSNINLNSDQRIDIELKDEGQKLQEVVITGEADDINVSGIQMSVNKLDMKTVQKMPAFLGEADVIKSIQLMPGVSTVGEGASGFNVRGGSVGQNQVLLDEAPVYNSSHMLGFFSVFNPDAVKDVQLYKGGIPARYGGRISSVLDIRMNEGNSKKFEGQGGIGTIFSRLALEGPIQKDKSSFIIAGRRSYIDVLARPTGAIESGQQLYFYDLTMKTNWNINDNNRVYLSGYLGQDVFMFDAGQGFRWGNKTTTLRWNHIYSNKLFSNFSLFYSNYDYSLSFGDEADDKFDWTSDVKNVVFKPEFTYFLNPKNELTFGGEASYLIFEPANSLAVSDGVTQVFNLDRRFALESGLYIANDQKLTNSIQLQYGIRYSNYLRLGNGFDYELGEAELGTERPVTEGRTYDRLDVMKQYDNLEPRFSVKYQFDDKNSFKASYNKMSQYVHLVSNAAATNPTDVWTPSSNNIKPQIGHQVAAGWFRNFGEDNQIEFSAETYYRWTKNQIGYISGAQILFNPALEASLLSGKGRAYGLELMAKKTKGQWTGWVGYTLAWTELKIDGINQNEWYPTRFDQRHNISTTLIYEMSKRWTFSTNFLVVSGTPINAPNLRYSQLDYTLPHSDADARNNFRIPSYHRLDLSATWYTKSLRKDGSPKPWKSHWVFSVYNMYGRRNPFSIYFIPEDERLVPEKPVRTEARQVSILGSFVPAVSYNFTF